MSEGESDVEFEEGWVPYGSRPEWNDIQPIPQTEDETAAVRIMYSDKFIDVYNYFRGIMKVGEKSERTLKLTADAIQLNSANYTVWQYRRDILKELKCDLHQELTYLEKVMQLNSKNYQVWHHRHLIVEQLKDPSRELEFTERYLDEDAKHYHAWQHRQWVIKTFNLFDNELEFTDKLIRNDIRNNSAWNERYFVLNNTTNFEKTVLDREIDYTLKAIDLAKENESAWNYLRGLLLHEDQGLMKNDAVVGYCEKLYQSGNRSPFLLAFIIDICEEFHNNNVPGGWFTLELAKELCAGLAGEHDKIREKYWNYLSESIQAKMSDVKLDKDEPTGNEASERESNF